MFAEGQDESGYLAAGQSQFATRTTHAQFLRRHLVTAVFAMTGLLVDQFGHLALHHVMQRIATGQHRAHKQRKRKQDCNVGRANHLAIMSIRDAFVQILRWSFLLLAPTFFEGQMT